jgi:hypothetical protein
MRLGLTHAASSQAFVTFPAIEIRSTKGTNDVTSRSQEYGYIDNTSARKNDELMMVL